MTISAVLTMAVLLVVGVRSKSTQRFFVASMAVLLAMSMNSITATAFYIGSQEINCDDLALLACSACALALAIKGIRLSKNLIRLTVFLFLFIGLGVVSCVVWGDEVSIVTSSQSWDDYYYGVVLPGHVSFGIRTVLILVRMALFCFLLMVTQSVFRARDYTDVAHAVLAFSLAHVLFASFEFVTKVMFGSTIALTISQSVFVSFGSTYSSLVTRGDMTMIQGFTREGSHFAYAMFYTVLLCVLLYAKGELRIHEAFCLILSAVMLLVSGAFTSVICALVLIVFFMLAVSHRQRMKMKEHELDARIILLLIVVAVSALLAAYYAFDSGTYYVSKFLGVLGNLPQLISGNYSGTYASVDAMPRLVSMVESMRVFFSYPLFGIGLGTIDPFSGLSGILCTTGAAGLVSWLALIARYTSEASGKGSARFAILLFFSLGLLSLGASTMYSPTWILLCGLFWVPVKPQSSPKRLDSKFGGAYVP